ncbi:DNA polymerase III subunit gamma/tau [Thiohalocapsa marina]|uniref:DNA polymerase III subunit gamma/tau n=1 Tax=Thiohalocapsa marina TaxID=424902 RepID=A0A5M8FIP4_9GAMM|nr:DNA polymerase III subunit gamma/tau [Thiohalocapsa marina]KAA6184547.1 DNA polymerase III subunit gamma/tau [Thiohalocapsa marina]
MTYQVLARKWRPRTFADLVGQEHVVRALVNALERGQVHHAYLFTGTRGVGKTTLARILAKALNCEQGVGPTPCGVCATCREIDQGRYVDLIEVDAASRTKVDQTRELLDNVPFAPVRGRSKVYLIDEVHMFSGSSFNALLKTLEEPPEHVKFVLATTDPQKLPATVLSRCLQFNLKRLLPEQIAERFRQVLSAEAIQFDDAALALLARAADGSMRDGLSLLDQAIAFGGGRVGADDTRAMLGTRSGDLALNLVDALADGDGARVLAEVGRIAELTPDFAGVLSDLIDLLHRLALAQQVPRTLAADDPDHDRLAVLAQRLPAEDVQLYYQILLTGRQDLPLAPEPRTGLEMVLLRALAFRPADPAGGGPSAGSGGSGDAGGSGRPTPSPQPRKPGSTGDAGGPSSAKRSAAPADPHAVSAASLRLDAVAETPAAAPEPSVPATARPARLASAEDWHALVAALDVGGLARQLAEHCALVAWDGHRLRLALDEGAANLRNAGAEQRLRDGLAAALGGAVELLIEQPAAARGAPGKGHGPAAGRTSGGASTGAPGGASSGASAGTSSGAPGGASKGALVGASDESAGAVPGDATGNGPAQAIGETPALRRARDAAERQAQAEALLHQDGPAALLMGLFDARWIPGTLRAAGDG